jgi:hypothetical protein
MAEPAVQPRDPRDQFHPPSPGVAERLRADFARTQEQLAANLANHPAVVARQAREAEAAAEAELLAADPHQDLAVEQQKRAEAQQAVAEAELPLTAARAFVDELKAQERQAREAETMAAVKLAMCFSTGQAPRLELSAVEQTARRRSVAQAAVERLEQALSAAKDRLAEADGAVRRQAPPGFGSPARWRRRARHSQIFPIRKFDFQRRQRLSRISACRSPALRLV